MRTTPCGCSIRHSLSRTLPYKTVPVECLLTSSSGFAPELCRIRQCVILLNVLVSPKDVHILLLVSLMRETEPQRTSVSYPKQHRTELSKSFDPARPWRVFPRPQPGSCCQEPRGRERRCWFLLKQLGLEDKVGKKVETR